MKAKSNYLFFLMFSLGILSSCEKEIPYTGSDSDSLLVVNQIIEKDSTFSIGVQRSKFFLENTTDSPILEDAIIVLTNTTTGASETQTSGANGSYSFNMIAQEGHSYEVTASHANYPSASGSMTIPVNVPLISVDTMSFVDPEEGDKMEAKLKWNDPPGKNYYIIAVRYVGGFSQSEYISSNDVSITNGGTDFDGEATYDYFFSINDDTFDGTEKELTLEFQNYLGGSPQFYYQLFHCTEDTYRYLVSVNVDLNSGGGPFTEPVKVHTNIEGGYGIFSGMNKSQIIK